MRNIVFFLFFFVSFSSQAVDLELQFEKYRKTREALIDRVVGNGNHMTRTQWDAFLERDFEIDEMQIREEQNTHIKEQARRAKIESETIYGIGIDSFRSDAEKVKRFCSVIPKGAMLHVHADGTLNRSTVQQILDLSNPEVNGVELLERVHSAGFDVYNDEINPEADFLNSISVPKKYSELGDKQEPLHELFFLPQEPYSHPFSRFMAFFFIKGIIYRGDMNYNEVTKKIYRDFLVRAEKNKVSYIEISDAQLRPKISTLTKLRKLAQLAHQYNIILRWNVAFYRNVDAIENEERMKSWIEFLIENPTPYITGIDFIADESNHPALEKGQGIYAQAYQADHLGQVDLKRTMHSGELGHPKNVRDAMIMGVERVGHGVKLWEDPVALEYARTIHLGVETNLVSNYRLRVVKDRQGHFCKSVFCDADHPFLKFHRLGLQVSFSTDDEGLFETTMNKECEVAVRTTDIQYSELREIALNSILSSFADHTVKQQLEAKLKQDLRSFEQSWE